MDRYLFMEECLQKFKYPNINCMDDDAVMDIFSNVNRQFLVTWLLKQIDKDYNEILVNASKEDLAEILYCSGFCNDSEKIQFMNGQCNSEIQFEVFNRMFCQLSCSANMENNDDIVSLSNKGLEDLVKMDTNLFPTFGAKKTLISTERKNKMKEYQQEIEDLESAINTIKLKGVSDAPQLEDAMEGRLLDSMKILEGNLPDFRRKILEILKNVEGIRPEHINFHNLAQTLAICNGNFSDILEFIRSTNVIKKFEENNHLGEGNLNSNDKERVMVRQLSQLCSEVIEASNKTSF